MLKMIQQKEEITQYKLQLESQIDEM